METRLKPLRDRILLGVNNLNLRKRLLQKWNIDLKEWIDLCRNSEAAASHLKNLTWWTNNLAADLKETQIWEECQGKRHKLIIGLLLTVSWFKICHAGGQAHYYSRTGTSKQRPIVSHPMKRELCPAWQKRCQKCTARNRLPQRKITSVTWEPI